MIKEHGSKVEKYKLIFVAKSKKYAFFSFNYYICKMKVILIIFCFALAAFAQEKQEEHEEHEEHENFTTRQRFGTWGLNTIVPGLGSIVIMEDWVGARNQWVLFGIGAGSLWLLAAKGGVDTGPSSFDIGGAILFVVGPVYLGKYFVYNITRSIYYNKPQNTNDYKDFTNGQRLGTMVLNIIPGLGSAVIMKDWEGAGAQWFFTGFALIGFTLDSKDRAKGYLVFFSVLNILYNINRSSTYSKPVNLTLDKYDGFHLSVLPNRRGEIMPYLLFNKAF